LLDMSETSHPKEPMAPELLALVAMAN